MVPGGTTPGVAGKGGIHSEGYYENCLNHKGLVSLSTL